MPGPALDRVELKQLLRDLLGSNYGTVIRNSQDMFGTSIFVKDDRRAIFRSYSTYHRGTELLMGAFNWLGLAPKGRNETGKP